MRSVLFNFPARIVFIIIFWIGETKALKNRPWLGPSQFVHSIPTPRSAPGFASVDGKLYLCGGAISGTEGVVMDLYELDPAAMSWTALMNSTRGTPPPARESHGFASVNSRLYLFGGIAHSVVLGDLFELNLATMTWTNLTGSVLGTPPFPRLSAGFAEVNKKLYVFGGSGGLFGQYAVFLNDLYEFDPYTMTWTELTYSMVGSQPAPRFSFGFAGVGGKLYIFGGTQNLFSAFDTAQDLYVLDPSLLICYNVTDSVGGTPPSPRAYVGFAPAGGKLYLFGGSNGTDTFNDVHELDPSTLAWTDLSASLLGDPPSRHEHGFAAVDDKLYVFGGKISISTIVDDPYMLDPFKLLWVNINGSTFGDPPSVAYDIPLVMASDKLYVFSGDSQPDSAYGTYEFDPVTMTWTNLFKCMGTPPFDRSSFGFASADDKLYIFAGFFNDSLVNYLHQLDLATMQWTDWTDVMIGESPSARMAFSFASQNGKVYVFGGWNWNGHHNDIFELDPASMSWTDLSSRIAGTPPSERALAGFTEANGVMYIFAGVGNGRTLNDLYELDLSVMKWTNLSADIAPSLPATEAHGFTSVEGRLYSFGGYDEDTQPDFYKSDLIELNVVAKTWRNLTDSIDGDPPVQRRFPGFASVDRKLYIFGGLSVSGALGDLFAVSAPKDHQWSTDGSLIVFTSVYDWDIVLVEGEVQLNLHLNLCLGALPCKLSIQSSSRGSIRLQQNGALSCNSSLGCISISVKSVELVCQGRIDSNSPFTLEGSSLTFQSSSISGCTSRQDGGAIQSYGNASIAMLSSEFSNLYSLGFGGAVSVVGSAVTVSNTTFLNCSSELGGGAIRVSQDKSFDLSALIHGIFMECRTVGSGGAIYISSSNCSLSRKSQLVQIFETVFEGCSAGEGGAMVAIGSLVSVKVMNSSFRTCLARDSGGAAASIDSATLLVIKSSFENNIASGNGGGAFWVQDAFLTSIGSSCKGNSANSGGGGVVLWKGVTPPGLFSWCPSGAWSSPEVGCTTVHCPQLCALCPAGTFQTGEGMIGDSCRSCEPGTYSSASGASECLECMTGMFSNETSLSACFQCEDGFCSDPGATECFNCTADDNPWWRMEDKDEDDSNRSRSLSVDFPVSKFQNSCSGTNLEVHQEHEVKLLSDVPETWNEGSLNLACSLFRRFSDLKLASNPFKFREETKFYARSESQQPLIMTYTSLFPSTEFCGLGNTAHYGSCLASTFVSLEMSNLQTQSARAYAGLPFSVIVTKLDFYSQVISSDSSSLLRIQIISDATQQSSAASFLSGNTVSNLEEGRQTFSIAIHPIFAELVPSASSSVLRGQPQIYVQGTDTVTKFQMTSASLQVMIADGSLVCPRGYILSLDGVSHGSCVYCGAGTYSVSPLVGATDLQPSCLQCPAGGECTGGDAVRFSLGTWNIVAGKYILVGCPAGHQLVNTVQGVLSLTSQNCLECQTDQYILDSNNSNFTCQTCPIGAICDGNTLRGRTAGSVWRGDMQSGKYFLESCPNGFVVQATPIQSQQCLAWSANVFVALDLTLPLSVDEFNASLQLRFRNSIASIASSTIDAVMIESVAQKRRSVGSTIEVASKIATVDAGTASKISGNMTFSAINSRLATVGLPEALRASTAVVDTTSRVDGNGSSVGLASGVIIGGIVALIFAALGFSRLFFKLRKQAENKAFIATIASAKDGDKASQRHLPFDLRSDYVALGVLGRGAFGCVIKAQRRGGKYEAIKFVLPSKGKFDELEIRHLRREAHVLSMFSSHKCEHAVHSGMVGAVHLFPELCWFVMELVEGDNMEAIIKDAGRGPIGDIECIRVARSVLGALSVMHNEGLVHRDIKPANIMRCERPSDPGETGGLGSDTYKLIDFGTTLGVDESLATEVMMTTTNNRQMGAGTPPYMSPEMYKEPQNAKYPTDLWSLGVTMFELTTGSLPFQAESEFLWSLAIAGNMEEKAPSLLDKLVDERRSTFDHNLAKVVSKALEKKVVERFQSADEMHDAIYQCLIQRGEGMYSAFISYRVASEAPLARLLFDDLNHSVTPGGHRVTIYWDAHRLVSGQNWEQGFANGLLHSLCFFPLLSYGSTAPLAAFPAGKEAEACANGWDLRPCGRQRLQGLDSDPEDNVLKEFLIASALLDYRRATRATLGTGQGLMQLVYPILTGRPQPAGHPEYPHIGNYFHVHAGGGRFPNAPSPPTARAVFDFLSRETKLPANLVQVAVNRSVESVITGLTSVQGCQLSQRPPDLGEMELSKEQKGLVGMGYAGPAVNLGGIALTDEQRESCSKGLDERQLKTLKALIRAKRPLFHEVIDRAVHQHSTSVQARQAGSSGVSSASGFVSQDSDMLLSALSAADVDQFWQRPSQPFAESNDDCSLGWNYVMPVFDVELARSTGAGFSATSHLVYAAERNLGSTEDDLGEAEA